MARSCASSRLSAHETFVSMIGGGGTCPTAPATSRKRSMSAAAFGHSFCMTTIMPKPSLAMTSADSGVTEETKNRRSGLEIGRGRIEVRGIL